MVESLSVKHKHNMVLTPEHVTWLRTFADSKGGISQAANFLGLSRNALTRAVAQLGIHRGTAALLEQQIEARAEGKRESTAPAVPQAPPEGQDPNR